MKKTSRIPVPRFASEDEEREFWATADSTRYIDWDKAKRTISPNLKPTLRSISLRLPELLIANVKVLANKRDVPYQTLLKNFLAERIEEEMRTVQEKGLMVREAQDGTAAKAGKRTGKGEKSKTRHKLKVKAGKTRRHNAGKALRDAVNK